MYYINLIRERLHKPNSKSWMKYYIGKDLYELFDYAIVWGTIWEIEFFTQNEYYNDIWSKLNFNNDYGRVRLVDCEYMEQYQCYTVSVFAPDLIRFLRSMNDHCNVMGEKIWKGKAKNCGWNDDEVNQGYVEYKRKCDEWFERHYGKHINLCI